MLNSRKMPGRGLMNERRNQKSMRKELRTRSLTLDIYIKQVKMHFWNPIVNMGQLVHHRDGI